MPDNNTKNPTKVVVRSAKKSDTPYTRADLMRDLAKVSSKAPEKPQK